MPVNRKELSCELCDKIFHGTSNLYKHIRLKHGIEPKKIPKEKPERTKTTAMRSCTAISNSSMYFRTQESNVLCVILSSIPIFQIVFFLLLKRIHRWIVPMLTSQLRSQSKTIPKKSAILTSQVHWKNSQVLELWTQESYDLIYMEIVWIPPVSCDSVCFDCFCFNLHSEIFV